MIFSPLARFEERTDKSLSAVAIAMELNKQFQAVQGALIFSVQPPPVRGIGTTGGFKMQIQDTRGGDLSDLGGVANQVVAPSQSDAGAHDVFTTFSTRSPWSTRTSTGSRPRWSA